MRLVATLTIMALASVAAFGQSAAHLEAGLRHVPASVLSESGPVHVHFSAIAPSWARQHADGDPAAFQRLFWGAGRPIETLRSAPLAVWEEKAGLAVSALDYLLTYGQPPAETTVWGLGSEAAALSALEALAARGFEEMGADVWGNGAPGRADLTQRDPANPWRGSAGQASFVRAADATLIQTSSPSLSPMGGAQMAMADNPLVATALAGLGELQDEDVVQAMVISPLVGLAPPDMLDMLGKPLEEIRAEWSERAASETSGLSPFLSGIIADIQSPAPRLALSLTFPDCAIAATAAETIAARWTATMRTPIKGATSAAVAGPDGLCAGLVALEVESTANAANPAYVEIIQALMMNKGVPVLAVGDK